MFEKARTEKKPINVFDPGNDEELKTFLIQLQELLDLSESYTWITHNPSNPQQDPIVTPPLYGKWYSNRWLISKVTNDFQEPQWLHQRIQNLPHFGADAQKLLAKFIAEHECPWLNELNLDPVNRAAAGLGRIVIQTLQEELMASAGTKLEQ